MAKAVFILIIVMVFLVSLWAINSYNTVVQEFSELKESYNKVVQEKDELLEGYQDFKNSVFYKAEENCTVVTIVYHTNFSQNQHVISFSVPYEKYEAYHRMNHSSWGRQDLTPAIAYISSNETIINQIVETIRNQTQTDEELANALLNFVQDKKHVLSIRYYPTTELKYPLETLVEMGGDCDTKSILYGTLMKAAGFKVLLLFSNEKISDGQYHVATAIHLKKPPENSLSNYQAYTLTFNGEAYYYAETTNTPYRVGNLPPDFENLTFTYFPLQY